MQLKKGSGWKAFYDEENERYFGEYGGIQEYRLYELSKDQYDRLDKKMTESGAAEIMYGGRRLYMAVNDRCGPPYTIVFDDDYKRLCPWADVIGSGKVWPDELTDAAVELFASEKNNRGQRRKNREERERRENDTMARSNFTIGSRQCTAYSCGSPEYVLIQPVDESDERGLSEEIDAIRERTDAAFVLAAFSVADWNRELSPWEATPVFGKDGFGSGAEDTLEFILHELLPEVRARFCLSESAPAIIGGYSLAAFFALWASYRQGAFRAAACASPSVWFPGWMEFAKLNSPKAECAYLSLGDREERAKNRVMATVGDCIREQYSLLRRDLDEANCTLEWNEGNHFKDSALRCAKAFAWCLERIKG